MDFQSLSDLEAQCQRFYNLSGRDGHEPDDPSKLEDQRTAAVSGPEREEEKTHQDEDKLAAELAETVKVLCWVMTAPTNHQAKVTKLSITYSSSVISPSNYTQIKNNIYHIVTGPTREGDLGV